MKKLFGRLKNIIKGTINGIINGDKIKYIIVLGLVAVIAVTFITIGVMNTSEAEIPDLPDDELNVNENTMEYNTELIFDIIDDDTTNTDNDTEDETLESEELTDEKDTDSEPDETEMPEESEEAKEAEDPAESEDLTEPAPVTDPIINKQQETTASQQPAPKPAEATANQTTSTPVSTTSKQTAATEPQATAPKQTDAATTKPKETTAQTTAKPVETTSKPVETTSKPVETTSKPKETANNTSGDEPAQTMGQFVLKEKKYDYNGANVSIVNVENKSDKAYTITITAKFKDKNGKELKSESITFEGFDSGWKNSFFFEPGIKYDSVSFGMKAKEYTEKINVTFYPDEGSYCSLTQTFVDSNNVAHLWKATEDCELRLAIAGHVKHKSLGYSGDKLLEYTRRFAIIDSYGNLIILTNVGLEGSITKCEGGEDGYKSSWLIRGTSLYWDDRDSYEIPDDLKNITMIRSILSYREY